MQLESVSGAGSVETIYRAFQINLDVMECLDILISAGTVFLLVCMLLLILLTILKSNSLVLTLESKFCGSRAADYLETTMA